MRQINRCLNKQLIDLCQRSLLIDSLNNQLLKFLPESLVPHCKIASFNKGCLLIITNNTWATELRYVVPTLRDDLRSKAGLYQLSSIKIQVALENSSNITTPKKIPNPLTAYSKETIRNTALTCNYSPLKDALLALTETISPSTLLDLSV